MIVYEKSAFKFSTLQGCKTIRTLMFRTKVSCLIIITSRFGFFWLVVLGLTAL